MYDIYENIYSIVLKIGLSNKDIRIKPKLYLRMQILSINNYMRWVYLCMQRLSIDNYVK